ncbi:MAG: putative Cytochrome b6-f complex iron-sulfur subunit [Ignavibacteria bacterium]|nr:putative Cytochrome b6-f complex iron-sulfur subunit [Ignavibacteria bacterium]
MSNDSKTEPIKTEDESQKTSNYFDDHSLYGRRRFLKGVFTGIGIFGTGFLGASSISFLSSAEAMESKPVELSLANIPVGERIKILYNNQPAEVIRTEKEIIARSLVCTHLGCIVMWEKDNNRYYCPCHDAIFDANGKVVSGPPSMPLENIKVTVKGSSVVVGNI